ncbi:MAG: aldo/keto reductase [Steroidobacteraceae bacterium]
MTFDTRTGPPRLDRRTALQLAVASALITPMGWAASGDALIRKSIPVSGEPLPIIGLGTNNYSPTTDTERADRRAVLERLTALGASVIDTAPAYRESERTLGELIGEIGNRSKIFLATKVTSAGGTREEGIAMLEESMRRLRTSTIDLMQVHNLVGAEVLLPLMRDWQQQRRIRYVGITTSRAAQYPEVARLMRSVPLDFVQLDYSIANRGAAEQLLPLAAERKIAVLVNLPFGGRRDGNLFAQVRNISLPPVATDIGATSWAQFFLKYVVSHPAVTCAIPGMTKVTNLEDNLGAARGTLPDAAQRRAMEIAWDALGA